MCQLTHDVENIIYRKMVVKGTNTDPQNCLWYRDRFPSTEYYPHPQKYVIC